MVRTVPNRADDRLSSMEKPAVESVMLLFNDARDDKLGRSGDRGGTCGELERTVSAKSMGEGVRELALFCLVSCEEGGLPCEEPGTGGSAEGGE